MGDGRVALILDVLGIGQLAGVLTEREQAQAVTEVQQAETTVEQADVPAVPGGILRAAGRSAGSGGPAGGVPRSAIERAGGRRVVQYRGGSCPWCR
jgi:two-component system chemotaxis sensor kinase CheA